MKVTREETLLKDKARFKTISTSKERQEAEYEKKLLCGKISLGLFLIAFFSLSFSYDEKALISGLEKQIKEAKAGFEKIKLATDSLTKEASKGKGSASKFILTTEYRTECTRYTPPASTTVPKEFTFDVDQLFKSKYQLANVLFYSIVDMNLISNDNKPVDTPVNVYRSDIEKLATGVHKFKFTSDFGINTLRVCFMADGKATN